MDKDEFAELLTEFLELKLDEGATFNASILKDSIEFDVMFRDNKNIKLTIEESHL